MANFDTANAVLNDAAVELGLIPADLLDVYASTDPAIVQLRRLLKGLGRDLLRQHPWTHLQRTHVFATVAGQDTYPLPDDFNRIIDSTAWSRSQQMPLGGPYYAQGWQLLKAESAAGTVWLNFRIVGGRFALHPTPGAAETLAYEYVSDLWVGDAPAPAPATRNTTVDATDEFLHLDARLLVTGLILRFRQAKGFDTQSAQRNYNDAYSFAKGNDGAAPVLSFDGCAHGQMEKPVTTANAPDGGLGYVLDVGGLF